MVQFAVISVEILTSTRPSELLPDGVLTATSRSPQNGYMLHSEQQWGHRLRNDSILSAICALYRLPSIVACWTLLPGWTTCTPWECFTVSPNHTSRLSGHARTGPAQTRQTNGLICPRMAPQGMKGIQVVNIPKLPPLYLKSIKETQLAKIAQAQSCNG